LKIKPARRNEFKPTIWQELNAEDCKIIKKYIPEGGTVEGGSIVVRHPKLKRPRSFVLSKKGNWYSRYTGEREDYYAEGYIIKGELIV